MTARRRWSDLPLWVKALAAGAFPALLLLATTVIGYRLHRDLDAAEADFVRAVAIQNDIQTLHILQVESAMAVRSHLLTRRLEALAPYERARSATPAILEAMQGRIRDPGVLSQFQTVVALVAQFERDHAALLQSTAAASPEALRDALSRSREVLDRLRREVGEMQRRESTLVARFAMDARRATELNYRFSLIASVLILISSAAAVLLLLGSVTRRIARLVGNAERLVRDQPLLAIEDSRDELGELSKRLDLAARLLAERATAAQAASEAKSRFLSRTSHELRTPLQAIVGHAQLLASDAADRDPVTGRRAGQIDTAARHLLQLIDDILDLASAEAGRLHLSVETVEVVELIGEVTALLEPVVDRHGLTVAVTPPPAPCRARADRRRLHQVLLNLVSNAIKFNRPGGSVRIACRAGPDGIGIDVRDDGPGFTEADLGRLFLPLERLDADRRGIAGSGLGLAITRQLVDAMGGTLTVQSVPGAGATFTIRLPAAEASGSASDPTPPPAALPAPVPDETLLLCGVDRDQQAILAALLSRQLGWQLHAVDELADLAPILQVRRPALVVFGEVAAAEVFAATAASASAVTPLLAVLADAETPLPAGARRLTRPLQVRAILSLLETCRR